MAHDLLFPYPKLQVYVLHFFLILTLEWEKQMLQAAEWVRDCSFSQFSLISKSFHIQEMKEETCLLCWQFSGLYPPSKIIRYTLNIYENGQKSFPC